MVLPPGVTLPADGLTVSIAIDIYGDDGDNLLRGNISDNYIYGRGGNDVIFGEGGRDILYGEDGNDILFAGKGNQYGGDVLYGGDGNDILNGGKEEVFHEMYGGNGDDSLYIGGFNWAYGGQGNDTFIIGSTVKSTYIGDFQKGEIIQLPGGISVHQESLFRQLNSGEMIPILPFLEIDGYRFSPNSTAEGFTVSKVV
jgi:hypothetical protein